MQKPTNRFSDLNQNLLDKFNRRDENAFCFIYEYFYNELYYFASKLFSDTTILPYDVLQDIFLKVLENKKQFESFDLLKSYLYLSIRNRRKNELKHSAAIQRYSAIQNFDEKEENILSHIFESETLAILYNQLKSLPPECAKVIRLSLEGHKSPEIAQMLSISINTVYAQKQKALTILRNKLSKDMFVILLFVLSHISSN
ncbi:MAG TPA: sigma-70 family RNA polymerase sigma factor [Candidatus Butyricimonas faecavium]|nr:sigma-70 family RNA polymerase sigma factor [Candidatus Butyricimonas faecavium]